FQPFERFSRAAAGLAGAMSESPSAGSGPGYRVWLEDWSAEGSGPEGKQVRLQAAQEGVAIDLALATGRPVVLQGDQGLSQKSAVPGNASYYYSLTHMDTQGEVTIGGRRYSVRGLSWMDHEFGTGAIDTSVIGWDWYAIQLDDGR